MSWRGALVAGSLLAVSLPAAAQKRVAVVVGISRYPSLEEDVQPGSARDDARQLARYLEDHGGYEVVHVLLDAVATREGVRKLLLDTVPPTLDPGDTLLWAFVGHGFGADFGDPHLMAYDFDPADPQGTGIQLQTFAPELVQKLEGVDLMFITDAAHDGQTAGLALVGPSAKTWPTLQGSVFLLSAAAPGETAPGGMFLPALTEGLQGGADTSGDGSVTVSELHRYLLGAVAEATDDTVHPAEAGTYSPNLVVSVASGEAAAGATDKKPKPDRSGGWGGPVSYTMMGLGAASFGFGLYSYSRGRAMCDTESGELACPNEGDSDVEDYKAARLQTLIGYGAGGALFAAGVGLAFVPLDGGGWVGARGRF